MIDLSRVSDIEFSGVDNNDYPDYSDAFIESAMYRGREMTQEEMDDLMDNYREFVYKKLMEYEPFTE